MPRLIDDRTFASSRLYQELLRAPLRFIDIGARGGIQPFIDPVAELTSILAFEPDTKAAEQLKRNLQQSYSDVRIHASGIARKDGTAELYLYSHGVNHSLLKASEPFRQRYGVRSLEDRGSTQIAVRTLDSIIFEDLAAEENWGEFLKLDVQGAELQILQGAERTLSERTVAIVSEVCFAEIYKGQPRFSDIERHLAQQGFTFYGFLDVQGWSQKYIDKKCSIGAERLCFGNAVFLRDPLPGSDGDGTVLSQRQVRGLYLCALLFRYYDFAIEVAAELEKDDAESARLIDIAKALAQLENDATLIELRGVLSKGNGNVDSTTIDLLNFINKHRFDFDASDAALPRRMPRA